MSPWHTSSWHSIVVNAASCGSQSTMMLHSQLLSFRSLHVYCSRDLCWYQITSRICGAPDTHEQFQSLPLPTSLTFLIHAVQHAGHKHRPQWRIRIPLTAGTARIAETRRITTHTGGAQERVACKKSTVGLLYVSIIG